VKKRSITNVVCGPGESTDGKRVSYAGERTDGTDGERFYVSWSKDRWCGMYYVSEITDDESCIMLVNERY
jgi:hypothetical protein